MPHNLLNNYIKMIFFIVLSVKTYFLIFNVYAIDDALQFLISSFHLAQEQRNRL